MRATMLICLLSLVTACGTLAANTLPAEPVRPASGLATENTEAGGMVEPSVESPSSEVSPPHEPPGSQAGVDQSRRLGDAQQSDSPMATGPAEPDEVEVEVEVEDLDQAETAELQATPSPQATGRGRLGSAEVARIAMAQTYRVLINGRMGDDGLWDHDGYASGVHFDGDWILTAAHVVDDAESLVVVGPDGVGRVARRWYADSRADIGVIELDDPGMTPGAARAARRARRSRDLAVGETVYMYGEGSGFTRGVVSALHNSLSTNGRRHEVVMDYIQFDAESNRGNSGGGLYDERGHLIGVAVASLATQSTPRPGTSFAVPARHATRIARQLIQHSGDIEPRVWFRFAWRGLRGTTEQYRRGFRIVTPTGVAVTESESSALREGDQIVRANGVRIDSSEAFTAELKLLLAGEDMTLVVRRAGQHLRVRLRGRRTTAQ